MRYIPRLLKSLCEEQTETVFTVARTICKMFHFVFHEKRKQKWVWKTWGRINDDRPFIFEGTVLLTAKASMTYDLSGQSVFVHLPCYCAVRTPAGSCSSVCVCVCVRMCLINGSVVCFSVLSANSNPPQTENRLIKHTLEICKYTNTHTFQRFHF